MLFASPMAQVLTVRRPLSRRGKTARGPRRQGVMTTSQTRVPSACRRDGPPADVTEWRRCRLLEAGFPFALATSLARTTSVDVHALLQLVDCGCPPELAARILSPLDAPR